MWIVELVKNTITGHIRTPIVKARLGHRYARQGRRLQTSSPTTACASRQSPRSEEHTSELQSRRDLVCRLLLEKKNNFFELGTDIKHEHIILHHHDNSRD